MTSHLSDSEKKLELKNKIMGIYHNEINMFPPELQSSSSVLYCIVKSIVLHNYVSSKENKESEESKENHINDQRIESHHFIDGVKLNKLNIQGPDGEVF